MGSPGRETGDFLFLPFCFLANLPLFFGGMGMHLGLGVEEEFTLHLIIDLSVAKHSKGTSVDIETSLKDIPFLR